MSITFLCLASYYKGAAFMEEARRQGCRVLLLTIEKLKGEPWPHHALDDIFYMPELNKYPDIIRAVSYLARQTKIDRIIPLDDYDVETAARLREHLRVPGMGDTTARHFRDKLAMRVQARDEGVPVPDFVHVLNHGQVDAFMKRCPAPWVLKPRSEAGSVGIKKLHHAQEVWDTIASLGDLQSYYLMEQYVAGDVYHVDSIVYDRKILFSQAHRYGIPPFNVWNHGGVFSTKSLDKEAPELGGLLAVNDQVIRAMGLVRGVTHAEFIRGADGQLYYLEMAARVGGANIDVLVDKATGVNLWAEWVKLELANFHGQPYKPPKRAFGHAGLMLCLSKQAEPDLSHYDDADVVWKLKKDHHAGLIVNSRSAQRRDELMNRYLEQMGYDFLAIAPPTETAV
ncbi:MAG: ATP-grasp domain-containing protein [Candidatus Eremiobacteraeota bacterium]|nr:ATP-grasp domain-containing protein [Candidatus Eremiobacteraeota bacterium]MCW5867403.1 ATP-grasp domain-containing protein [Candidatus Eremiobacteraeota bacterium]